MERSLVLKESAIFATGHGPFPSYLYRFQLHHSDIFACGEKGDTFHYATSCHMTLSYHFTKPSAENTQLSWKSLLSNKLSRINIAKLISFLTENENLINGINQVIRNRPRFLSFTKTSDLWTKILLRFNTSDPNQSSYKYIDATNFWELS
ncbi:hypothetical protein AVEN_244720-1 [Araneus ventricosus]|uniref:Uncharacterized protein n=1 Tax=Araneus ventricosus TaxID=182803 RepID=A0A4Y2BRZ4_ARAVE|nr:hypothetical protein AVEN_244720-1 [Araneus ventricosus]